MTFKEKFLQDHPGSDPFGICPSHYDYEPGNPGCCMMSCEDCWNREMPGTEKESERKMDVLDKIRRGIPGADPNEMIQRTPRILDSGNRRQFESGAVRDIQEGKGRCDLLPLDVVAEFIGDCPEKPDPVPHNIYKFQLTGDICHLYEALDYFVDRHFGGASIMENCCNAILEVAIHFEEGAKKYGDSNWQKGIPVRCYIDSAVRHYLKFLRGDKDEPHDRAFCWNILCAIWTCKHKPELNDYAKVEEK